MLKFIVTKVVIIITTNMIMIITYQKTILIQAALIKLSVATRSSLEHQRQRAKNNTRPSQPNLVHPQKGVLAARAGQTTPERGAPPLAVLEGIRSLEDQEGFLGMRRAHGVLRQGEVVEHTAKGQRWNG